MTILQQLKCCPQLVRTFKISKQNLRVFVKLQPFILASAVYPDRLDFPDPAKCADLWHRSDYKAIGDVAPAAAIKARFRLVQLNKENPTKYSVIHHD